MVYLLVKLGSVAPVGFLSDGVYSNCEPIMFPLKRFLISNLTEKSALYF